MSRTVVNELAHVIFSTTKELGTISIQYYPDFVDEDIKT